jgi:hypothetical protein
MLERYKTGQSRKALRYIREANREIAKFVQGHSFETKRQYAIGVKRLREQTKELTDTLFRIIVKDLKAFIKVEREFVADVSLKPLDMEKVNDEKILNDILFDTFSDTDTIQSFIDTLGERIFKLWDGQFRVAYMTGMDSKQIVKAVLG